jgi:hypothetical protein
MQNVIDISGQLIGKFDGTFVLSVVNQERVYRIDDEGDVFSTFVYTDDNLSFMNKGQQVCVGRLVNWKCISDSGGELFTIETSNHKLSDRA